MERTVLAYPKEQFSRDQVMREKNKFDYPKAWRYDSKGKMHYLVLEPKLFERHYVHKKHHSEIIDLGEPKGFYYGTKEKKQSGFGQIDFDFGLKL